MSTEAPDIIPQFVRVCSPVVVTVKQLLQIEGGDQLFDFAEVEHFHIRFNQHRIVYTNGLEQNCCVPDQSCKRDVVPLCGDS